MRSIFYSLVAVNLVLLGVFWFQSQHAAVPVQDVQPSRPATDGVELTLLSEVERGDHLQEAGERLQVPVKRERLDLSRAGEEGGQQNAMCTFIGPFKELLAAEYMVENLAAMDVGARVRRLEVPGQPSYWVYQEPQSSRKSALRRLHELQAKGIDSYVIPRGDLENGISFGLYNAEAGARARLEEIVGSGYEADVRRVDRSFEEIWVSMPVAEADTVAESVWFKLLNREDGLEKRQNFCPDVASE